MLASKDAPVQLAPWNYTLPTIDPLEYQYFNASVRMQQYASGGNQDYEKGFIAVLFVVVLMSGAILIYFLCHRRWYADLSEPTHLFTLALQSPANEQIAGSCGTGPKGAQYKIRWKLDSEDGHYFLKAEEKESKPSKVSGVKKRLGWKEGLELLLRR